MPGQVAQASNRIYLTIVGGQIVQKVDKETPNARKREYELPDKTKGVKWELVYQSWEGHITGISFKDGDYGEQCIIEFDDAILTLSVTGRYFQDFACKIFNADLMKPIKLHPYDMEVEGGKRRTGISVQQGDKKLQNFFYDYETKKSINGFPEVDQSKTVKKTYWKTYFIEVADFLVEKLKTLKFTEDAKDDLLLNEILSPNPEVDAVDMPF